MTRRLWGSNLKIIPHDASGLLVLPKKLQPAQQRKLMKVKVGDPRPSILDPKRGFRGVRGVRCT